MRMMVRMMTAARQSVRNACAVRPLSGVTQPSKYRAIDGERDKSSSVRFAPLTSGLIAKPPSKLVSENTANPL